MSRKALVLGGGAVAVTLYMLTLALSSNPAATIVGRADGSSGAAQVVTKSTGSSPAAAGGLKGGGSKDKDSSSGEAGKGATTTVLMDAGSVEKQMAVMADRMSAALTSTIDRTVQAAVAGALADAERARASAAGAAAAAAAAAAARVTPSPGSAAGGQQGAGTSGGSLPDNVVTREQVAALVRDATLTLAASVDDAVGRAIGRRHVITPADAIQAEARSAGGRLADSDTVGARYFAHPIHRRANRVSGVLFADGACRNKAQYVSHLAGAAIVVEVGAEAGQDLPQFADLAERVYVYEADAGRVDELYRTINAAGMQDTTIVRQVAVSNTTGTMTHRAGDKVTVTRAVTLSSEIKEHVHFLSISTDGHELQVLDGATDLIIDYDIDYIHLALHPTSLAAAPGLLDATLQWLHDAGYVCLHCRDGALELAFSQVSWSWREFAAIAQRTSVPQLMCI